MWQRWRRLSIGGASTSASNDKLFIASPRLSPNHSFSSNDLRSILDDVEPPHPTPKKASAVFHRVRAASAALRALKAPATEKRIVLYYTSLRIVRKTFEECKAVRSILHGFHVLIDERDLSMDSGFLAELKGILGKKNLTLPQVFIGGRYVGGFEEIQALHENGELKKLIEGVPVLKDNNVCQNCGGMRFILCKDCDGSRKIYSEKKRGFRSCGSCNENGLVRCSDCF